ncbi:TetR/AcrR family transcriptional regulator [Acinetobacter populi]|uniref:TetR family transcriptional regulator n=1 Tax=Acinetobacter populi TaxID=1582270 RepID=A0A1Z9YXD7_9GAMM|nr:TetR/AcrR family transcriptional regulator [Acinetobacter populi]OUY06865.1 TetR family transcriptional regulator [Acinetobacter populi]
MTTLNEKSMLILHAARRIFLTHGFSAATTDMIQKEAKVSKATLYHCFANKEAMFAAVIKYQCQQMANTVNAIETSSHNIEQSLRDLGHAYLKFILSPDGLAFFRVAIAEAPRFPALARQFYLSGPRQMMRIIAQHLEQAVDDGQIDVQQFGYETSASLFINLLRGEGQLECLTHPEAQPSDAQIDFWVGSAVTTFLKAFAR